MCHKSWGLRVRTTALYLELFHLRFFVHELDESLDCVVLEGVLVDLVEVEDAASAGVLEDMEVAELGKQLRDGGC